MYDTINDIYLDGDILIFLTDEDIKKYEVIGSGGFGTIYKNGSKVYKIYHEYVYDEFHCQYINPSLKYRHFKLNRLINLNKKIKKTDLIEDVIFLNNKFSGVVMPYYEGTTLNNIMDKSIKYKIGLSKQLLENSKELTNKYIYPMDYKLNNLMVSNDEIKIIDLDDIFTKVSIMPNFFNYKRFIFGLDATIKTFLNEYQIYFLNKNIVYNLEIRKQLKSNFTYEDIDRFVEVVKQTVNSVAAHNQIY